MRHNLWDYHRSSEPRKVKDGWEQRWVSLLAALLLFSALSLAFTQNEPKRLLQDANSAFRSGDRDRARLLFETLTALYPQSPEAAEGWFRLGQIESEDLFLDEALRCFTQVVQHPAASPRLKAIADLFLGLVGIQKFTAQRWRVRRNGEESWVALQGRNFWQVLEDSQEQLQNVANKYGQQYRDVTAVAKLAIARIWLLRQFPRLAERTYWEVLKKWAGDDYVLAGLARYGIAVAKARQDEPEEAFAAFGIFLQTFHPGTTLDGLLSLTEEWRLKARVFRAFLLVGMGQREMALSELQAAEREGWQLAKGLQGERQRRVKEALAKVRRWQAHLLDEIDRREEAEEVLLDTFILLGDTTEGIKALDMLTFLPSRRR